MNRHLALMRRRRNEALERLMAGKTTITIAHHLETVQKADTIFVMDRGEIVESGEHGELLSVTGLYAQLYQTEI